VACNCICRTGKATYENGAVYEGDFRKDHRWGWGRQRFPDGSVYEGEWYDDLIEGASEKKPHDPAPDGAMTAQFMRLPLSNLRQQFPCQSRHSMRR